MGRPYLLKDPNEPNILGDCTENRRGLRYKTSLINYHCKTQVFNALCTSTVYLAFNRLQPLKTKIQKIQQGTKNEGKRKEAKCTKQKNANYYQRTSR